MAGLTALAAALATGPAWSAPPTAATPSDADRLQQVQAQIKSHQGMIEESQITILNLEQELHRLDSQIEKGQEALRGLQENLHSLEEITRRKTDEQQAVEVQKVVIAEHVKKRLAAFYQTGEVGVVNALFSATNLGDLLNMQVYVQTLFQYDQKVMQGFRDQIALLAKANAELAAARQQVQDTIYLQQDGEEELRKSREERDAVLAQTKAEKELYRQALQELESAATKLTATIKKTQDLEQKNKKNMARLQAKKEAAASPDTGFAAHQGRIQPPAPGQIIRVFGPYKDPFGNDLHADGLDLAVPPQTPVTSMHAGRVIFADQMTGYGNLVIIDHGEQYYSLLSGLGTLVAQKDEEVKTGDVIGTFGLPSGLINPGLHIEIRHGSTPVDPLLWLDPSQLNN